MMGIFVLFAKIILIYIILYENKLNVKFMQINHLFFII